METSVSPDGTVSVTVTFEPVAPAEAPLLTVTVYVAPCWPELKFPTCALAILRTGAATVTVGVLFAGADVPPPDTLSAMLTGVPFAEVTFPITVIGGKVCPAATELP
jgi:hypothetical protein